MKPSEIIRQMVMGRDYDEKSSDYLQRQIDAIIRYLDENRPKE